jgi:hypothetical protein
MRACWMKSCKSEWFRAGANNARAGLSARVSRYLLAESVACVLNFQNASEL